MQKGTPIDKDAHFPLIHYLRCQLIQKGSSYVHAILKILGDPIFILIW